MTFECTVFLAIAVKILPCWTVFSCMPSGILPLKCWRSSSLVSCQKCLYLRGHGGMHWWHFCAEFWWTTKSTYMLFRWSVLACMTSLQYISCWHIIGMWSIFAFYLLLTHQKQRKPWQLFSEIWRVSYTIMFHLYFVYFMCKASYSYKLIYGGALVRASVINTSQLCLFSIRRHVYHHGDRPRPL